jgi:hypothetical protein
MAEEEASKIEERIDEARDVRLPLPYFLLVDPSGVPTSVPYAENINSGLLFEMDGEVRLRPRAEKRGWKFAEDDKRVTPQELGRYKAYLRSTEGLTLAQPGQRPTEDVIPGAWRPHIMSAERRAALDAAKDPGEAALRIKLTEVEKLRLELSAGRAELDKLLTDARAAAGKSDDVDLPDGEPSSSWTVAQLRAYAEEAGLELPPKASKPELLAEVLAYHQAETE